jgi:hypothetical protein
LDAVGSIRWDRGGRLYAAPTNFSYQSLSPEERLQIRLNGEEVAEIDIKASHLTLAYKLLGKSLAGDLYERNEDDPYAIDGLPRPVVKLFVTAMFGAGRMPERWPQGARERLSKSTKGRKPLDLRRYKVSEVKEAVLRRHPVVSDLSEIEWGRLQFIESEAVIRAALRLKREFSVPSLPVHDSLIVPISAWWVAKDVLWLTMHDVAGCEPVGLEPRAANGRLPLPEETRYASARAKLSYELVDF